MDNKAFTFFVLDHNENLIYGFTNYGDATTFAERKDHRTFARVVKLDKPLDGGKVTHQWIDVTYLNGERSGMGWSDHPPLWLPQKHREAALAATV